MRRMNFDAEKFRKGMLDAVKAGHAARLLRDMEENEGIIFDRHIGEPKIASKAMALDMAYDATPPQSELVTGANAGIPIIFTTWVDPAAIEILVSPMMATKIVGETGKGTWVDDVAMFKVTEATGEVSSYGDYSRSGSTDVNYNFPQRQNYLFQAFLQYGDREVARAAKAKINLASDKQRANALAMNKALNYMYFYGVANLQNYGLLNDPNLQTPIAPQYSWLTSPNATALTIYQDVVRLYALLQEQSRGVVQNDMPMTLAMSNLNAVMLNEVTTYNTNSVLMLLKQNYPNLKLVTAPEYTTPSGELVQLIVDRIEGEPTAECAFSTKMMAHRTIQQVSSIEQKRTSGGWGTIVRRPFAIAQMLG